MTRPTAGGATPTPFGIGSASCACRRSEQLARDGGARRPRNAPSRGEGREGFLKRGVAVIEPALTETSRGQFGQIEAQKHAEARSAVGARLRFRCSMPASGVVHLRGQRQTEEDVSIATL